MTIYYTLTFAILCIEMFLFCLLVVPLPARWRRAILKFSASSPLVAKALYFLKIIFAFIFVLFIDAFNRLQHISERRNDEHNQPSYHDYNAEAAQKANRFYAQRNLYLCGFTLFLSLILERTTTVLNQMIQHEDELNEHKTRSASKEADEKRLLEIQTGYENEIEKLEKELKELQSQNKDMNALKMQAQQQSEEYSKLAAQKSKLASVDQLHAI
ncbi:B-cell receptor-associated protein 31-like-domain-containing protein [Mycotypha africana]|uniref:B-cell receptor-associated protein 31-like-domain-containing protein n=1 Tax=Mycotypha africana TaxID=64632 RepID=UPI0023018328|nr:B-cell receptor-associated protein 31-like-domain-containing protein [Mycotypha africana]KAI8977231.1 B-cell receptor-associated protein 31-like-domain-containing protein [Mycotypha africana]